MSSEDEYDEREIARRMERGLRQALNSPAQPHGRNPATPPTPKPKERPASKGCVHKFVEDRVDSL
jgi:hypothetical protein